MKSAVFSVFMYLKSTESSKLNWSEQTSAKGENNFQNRMSKHLPLCLGREKVPRCSKTRKNERKSNGRSFKANLRNEAEERFKKNWKENKPRRKRKEEGSKRKETEREKETKRTGER